MGGRVKREEKLGGASRDRDTKNNLGLKKGGLARSRIGVRDRLRREEGTAGKNFLSPDPFPFLPAFAFEFLGRIAFLILNLFYKKGSSYV